MEGVEVFLVSTYDISHTIHSIDRQSQHLKKKKKSMKDILNSHLHGAMYQRRYRRPYRADTSLTALSLGNREMTKSGC